MLCQSTFDILLCSDVELMFNVLTTSPLHFKIIASISINISETTSHFPICAFSIKDNIHQMDSAVPAPSPLCSFRTIISDQQWWWLCLSSSSRLQWQQHPVFFRDGARCGNHRHDQDPCDWKPSVLQEHKQPAENWHVWVQVSFTVSCILVWVCVAV